MCNATLSMIIYIRSSPPSIQHWTMHCKLVKDCLRVTCLSHLIQWIYATGMNLRPAFCKSKIGSLAFYLISCHFGLKLCPGDQDRICMASLTLGHGCMRHLLPLGLPAQARMHHHSATHAFFYWISLRHQQDGSNISEAKRAFSAA